MKSRFLLELQQSPVLLQLVAIFASEIQTFVDACRNVIKLRGPLDATGENLNAVGRIVGQLRTLEDFDALAWFATDRDYQGADFEAPVWVINAPIAGNVVAGDGFFRQLIEAKVLRNHTQFASVPELQAFVNQAFGINISCRNIDKMTLQLIIPDDTDFNTATALERYEDKERSENAYLLPLAAGVKIGDVITLSQYQQEVELTFDVETIHDTELIINFTV